MYEVLTRTPCRDIVTLVLEKVVMRMLAIIYETSFGEIAKDKYAGYEFLWGVLGPLWLASPATSLAFTLV